MPRHLPRTIHDLVFHAARVLGSEEALPHDRHAAAYVVARSGELGRGALAAMPRARRVRTRALLDALAWLPLTPSPPRREPHPAPLSETSFDVAVAELSSVHMPLELACCTGICAGFGHVVGPSPSRCRVLLTVLRTAPLDRLHQTRLIRVLAQWSADEHAYGALVELAGCLAGAKREADLLIRVLHALRRAPRRILPLAWFLWSAEQEMICAPTPSRQSRVRELLDGLVDAGGGEPEGLRAFRERHQRFFRSASNVPTSTPSRQEVTE